MAAGAPNNAALDDTLRTSISFLANHWNIWVNGGFEAKKLVLKLAYSERLRYTRAEGLRTPNLALLFKVFGGFADGEKRMARPEGYELSSDREAIAKMFVRFCSQVAHISSPSCMSVLRIACGLMMEMLVFGQASRKKSRTGPAVFQSASFSGVPT